MSEIIEGKPQLAPGVCFICELSNPVRYIDTLRDFYGNVREHIDGRKYVCEECVTEFAQKFGFVTPAVARSFEADIDALKKLLADAQADLKAFEDLKAIVEHFGGKAVVAVEPKKVTARRATKVD